MQKISSTNKYRFDIYKYRNKDINSIKIIKYNRK